MLVCTLVFLHKLSLFPKILNGALVVIAANTPAEQLCYGVKTFYTHDFDLVHNWRNKLKLCILHGVEYAGGVHEH